jgi:hypothetical protein
MTSQLALAIDITPTCIDHDGHSVNETPPRKRLSLAFGREIHRSSFLSASISP